MNSSATPKELQRILTSLSLFLSFFFVTVVFIITDFFLSVSHVRITVTVSDGRRREFDNGSDVNVQQLFVVVVDNAGSANAHDGDLPSPVIFCFCFCFPLPAKEPPT